MFVFFIQILFQLKTGDNEKGDSRLFLAFSPFCGGAFDRRPGQTIKPELVISSAKFFLAWIISGDFFCLNYISWNFFSSELFMLIFFGPELFQQKFILALIISVKIFYPELYNDIISAEIIPPNRFDWYNSG